MYGLRWSCMARPASVQDITASDMAMHRRECGYESVELCVATSANV